jgi:hypothetical protein
MYYICNNNTFKSIYFAYFHSIASYGIILGENSSNVKEIFTLQKRIIRIMVVAHSRTSCRRLFKKLEILTVPSQYIYSLMGFFIGNQENFQTNSSVHNINTEINTFFVDQLQTCLVFREVHPTPGSEFLTALLEVLQV